MGLTSPVALPPVTAQYTSTLQPAGAQAPAAQPPYQFSRSADGKTRVDSGNMSVITNPAAAQTIVLNHLTKTATIQTTPPTTPAPPNPAMPQMPKLAVPGLPAMPQMPAVKVQSLGTSVLQGHPVVGTQFVVPPIAPPKPPQAPGAPSAPTAPQPAGSLPGMPKMPQIPGMPAVPKLPKIAASLPGVPKMPQIPGMPAAPKTPQTPAAPPTPTTGEVWTSPAMGVPMLTKVSGSFGQMTQVCKSAVPGEPHPSTFQIPQGYKVSGP